MHRNARTQQMTVAILITIKYERLSIQLYSSLQPGYEIGKFPVLFESYLRDVNGTLTSRVKEWRLLELFQRIECAHGETI